MVLATLEPQSELFEGDAGSNKTASLSEAAERLSMKTMGDRFTVIMAARALAANKIKGAKRYLDLLATSAATVSNPSLLLERCRYDLICNRLPEAHKGLDKAKRVGSSEAERIGSPIAHEQILCQNFFQLRQGNLWITRGGSSRTLLN